MKQWLCLSALVVCMLASGAAMEISEVDLLSSDIRLAPVQVCKNSDAAVYAETLAAVQPIIKEKGSEAVRCWYAMAVAIQYSYADNGAAFSDMLRVYNEALTDVGIDPASNAALHWSMVMVNPWCTKIKDANRIEAAIKYGEGKVPCTFERAQLMRVAGYPLEELEKAYAAVTSVPTRQYYLLQVYLDYGVQDKVASTFFQYALSGALASNHALTLFDRAYPMILATSTDTAALVKKLEMIVRIYTVKYRAWEAQNPKQDAMNNPWHMFINSVQDQINGLTGK